MKKAIIILLGLALLLTGCSSAVPVEEPVQTQEQLVQTASQGSADALSTLNLPEKFTGDWTGLDDCFIVHADATIQIPNGPIPTATVQRRSFSQADADKLMEVFLKGNTLYQLVNTKQELQELLENFQARQRGEIPMGDATPEWLENRIPELKKEIEEAPDESEIPLASTTFQVDERGVQFIEGDVIVDGKPAFFSINNAAADDLSPLTYVHFFWDDYRIWYERDARNADSIPVDCTLTEDQAMEMGEKLLTQLEIPNLVCEQIQEVQFEEALGYEMKYVRTVGGFPLSHLGIPGGATPENEKYPKSWQYEQITVCVTDEGVVYFGWMNPYTEPLIQEENVQLLPFEDIIEVFKKMIFVTNDYWRQANEKNGFDIIHNINVDKVELNLLRIRDKDSTAEGTIVPVWDFWATTKAHSADEEHRDLVYDGEYYEVVLTINAIDGTVVDRGMGY